MNRRYGRRELERLFGRLRERVPSVALRTTVMVGYPGEGRREFAELLAFLRANPFENLGAFVFSPQPGTKAAALPGAAPRPLAEERYHEVMRLQAQLASDLWERRVGAVTEALLLAPEPGRTTVWSGRTPWQRRRSTAGSGCAGAPPRAPGCPCASRAAARTTSRAGSSDALPRGAHPGGVLSGCGRRAGRARRAGGGDRRALRRGRARRGEPPDSDFLFGPSCATSAPRSRTRARRTRSRSSGSGRCSSPSPRAAPSAHSGLRLAPRRGRLHLLLDYVSHDDVAPIGLPFLWPLAATTSTRRSISSPAPTGTSR